MKKEINKIEKGNHYLVKIYDIITEKFVERVTETAYKFRVLKSDGSWYIEWILKKDFENDYEVLELLDENTLPPSLESENKSYEDHNKININNCPICHGSGEIPDDESTGGVKTCPKCWGKGYII